MRMRHAVALTLVGMLAAACDTRDDTAAEPGLLPGDDATATDQRDMLVARGEFQSTAQAEGLNVSGWAEVRQRGTNLDDGYELRVHLMGLGDGDHAWHIHTGTCESPGPIALALSDAPAGMGAAGTTGTTTQPGTTGTTAQPRTGTGTATYGTGDHTRDGIASDLNAGDDGMVEETVNIDGDHVRALQAHGSNLIVNVHQRGGDNPGPAIACAPLQLGAAGGAYGAQPGTTTQPGATTQPGTGTGTTTQPGTGTAAPRGQ